MLLMLLLCDSCALGPSSLASPGLTAGAAGLRVLVELPDGSLRPAGAEGDMEQAEDSVRPPFKLLLPPPLAPGAAQPTEARTA
ncbi:hypothetical protein T492DRAFT_879375, partial [Pavlovales sp. CCMP2436]